MRTVEDHLIDRLEATQTRKYAILARHSLGWEGLDRIDLLSLTRVREIWTVRGRAPFQLCFVNDDIRSHPGRTTLEGSTFVVRIPENARRKALFGDGYARFAIAREFAHAALRHPETRALLLEKYPPDGCETRRVLVSAFGSIDFQANVFAATLLIGDNVDPGSASPEELAVRHGIDVLSARVFFTEIQSAVR
ncbi:hypothetical protein [Bradyrhizobium mercantei]|uniref:hypothetical protein n=1 Tax=Bradyrhizobium mercantei TaxID=1904807 RepID=UPI001177EC94|nr:hypothetical protein [Bradyrhizobium mercantei]